ncbi:hypothetical protein DL96DRAFT_1580813 [Flagelloscypha sp. PMI_526]|nr:hypothetical protein DL96DRAFT_1580813 [Flagelloscypha sp. PMI_526]
MSKGFTGCLLLPLSLHMAVSLQDMSLERCRFPDLPSDIARTVIEITADVDRATAMALCRVSKLVYSWAVRRLYHTVSLHTTEGAQRFLCATTHRPALGSLVRFLEYRLRNWYPNVPKEILSQLTNLISLTWIGLFQPPFPSSHLPASLRQLRVHRDYHLTIPEESLDRVPCKTTLEILDLTIGYPEDNTPFFRVLDLPEFTSLQYLGFRSEWGAFTYHERTFVDTIEQDLIPYFPPTLKVCVVQLRLYYGSRISGRLRGLILGDLDDRILLCTSTRRVKTSPRGPCEDFVLYAKTESILSSGLPVRDGDCTFWDRAEELVERRRRLRIGWGGRFPRGEMVYVVKKPLRKTAKKVAKVMYVPVYVMWKGPVLLVERVWDRWFRR